MDSINLLIICISAFASVFIILTILAIFMYFIMRIFPAKNEESNSPLYAAIISTFSAIFPGTIITSIEEKE